MRSRKPIKQNESKKISHFVKQKRTTFSLANVLSAHQNKRKASNLNESKKIIKLWELQKATDFSVKIFLITRPTETRVMSPFFHPCSKINHGEGGGEGGRVYSLPLNQNQRNSFTRFSPWLFPYPLKSEKANSPQRSLSKPGPLANKKGNYKVNLCTPFAFRPPPLPKTSLRTDFHTKDPFSLPKHVWVYLFYHTSVQERRVRQRGRSLCRNIVQWQ